MARKGSESFLDHCSNTAADGRTAESKGKIGKDIFQTFNFFCLESSSEIGQVENGVREETKTRLLLKRLKLAEGGTDRLVTIKKQPSKNFGTLRGL